MLPGMIVNDRRPQFRYLVLAAILLTLVVSGRVGLGAGLEVFDTQYARKPAEPYWQNQWNFENRDPASGLRIGIDLNMRAAWSRAKGQGIVIAMADDGVELLHPDLAPRLAPELHFNFDSMEPTGGHPISIFKHGTSVAGLAVAQDGNGKGMIGAAPRARLASWVIYSPTTAALVSRDKLALMFGYASNAVHIQNHSWEDVPALSSELVAPTPAENVAISNAVTLGRGGKGVVMVHACGNGRTWGRNVNDNAFKSDPRVIAVAAARIDGRAASYSNPGAPILVAAPSGEVIPLPNGQPQYFPIFSTDRLGTEGYNFALYTNSDFSEYTFFLSFAGTSAAAPQISGLAALLLEKNPELTVRDLQQVLVLSSFHFDLSDPDLARNGAGLFKSHNLGFGIPDAGFALNLAERWQARPAAQIARAASNARRPIPDHGLTLTISPSVEGAPKFTDLHALGSKGVYPDTGTAQLPLVYVGLATNTIGQNLSGKAALIQRGAIDFSEKIRFAAEAGAAFAVIFDNRAGELQLMGNTEFSSIPAVFISQADGLAIVDYLASTPGALAQITLQTTDYQFQIPETLICEHVGVRVQTTHPLRGDLRITLVSPQGTRSVLQDNMAGDKSPGPIDWTYYSTHHFFESSAGPWTVHVSDKRAGNTGDVTAVSLEIRGVPILDLDRDALDDVWELQHFLSLQSGPKDDPDQDGYINSREQMMKTRPTALDFELHLDLAAWNENLVRLSWHGRPGANYSVQSAASITGGFTTLTNLAASFPVTQVYLPKSEGAKFYRVAQQ